MDMNTDADTSRRLAGCSFFSLQYSMVGWLGVLSTFSMVLRHEM